MNGLHFAFAAVQLVQARRLATKAGAMLLSFPSLAISRTILRVAIVEGPYRTSPGVVLCDVVIFSRINYIRD